MIVNENNFDAVYPQHVREKFWRQVEQTMERVFEKSSEPLAGFREATEEAPIGERILVFHDEPLKIAADLLEIEEETISDHQLQRYRELIGAEKPSQSF